MPRTVFPVSVRQAQCDESVECVEFITLKCMTFSVQHNFNAFTTIIFSRIIFRFNNFFFILFVAFVHFESNQNGLFGAAKHADTPHSWWWYKHWRTTMAHHQYDVRKFTVNFCAIATCMKRTHTQKIINRINYYLTGAAQRHFIKIAWNTVNHANHFRLLPSLSLAIMQSIR